MLGRFQFTDRDHAGRRLGAALRHHAGDRPAIVLAMPRGGVRVGARVAEMLDAPLDVFLVRKLGSPGQGRLVIGAIATGGSRILNNDVIAALHLAPQAVDRIVHDEEAELIRRQRLYRADRRFPNLVGETVILVDEGAATGESIRAAIEALREYGPRSIIAAVPVASPYAARLLRKVADECITLMEPESFHAVSDWYLDFSEVTDDDVRNTLTRAEARWRAAGLVHAGGVGA